MYFLTDANIHCFKSFAFLIPDLEPESHSQSLPSRSSVNFIYFVEEKPILNATVSADFIFQFFNIIRRCGAAGNFIAKM